MIERQRQKGLGWAKKFSLISYLYYRTFLIYLDRPPSNTSSPLTVRKRTIWSLFLSLTARIRVIPMLIAKITDITQFS
ncbi:MAG: hypothetical protein DWQ58_02410 [Microcystis aeruginosa TA09]|nr:MAG: hypothetical protein DWQ58_02410 [Microcystis aeruginosa TA09]